MTESAVTGTAPLDRSAEVGGRPDSQPFQPAIAVLGTVVILLGLSGLIDDSGLVEHPWWIVLVASLASVCAVVIMRTMQSLRRSS